MSETLAEFQDDLDLLADLLAFLPDPDEDEADEWWEKFAAVEQDARHAGHADSGRAYYIRSKLAGYRSPSTRWNARSLALYCLMFFDAPSPEMVSLVGRRMSAYHSGARWFESICAAAWRVYVPLDREISRGGDD